MDNLSLDTYVIAWVVIAVVFAALELVTTTFVSIYIALGAIGAAVVAGVGGGLGAQLGVFAALGVILLLLTRPVLKGRLEAPDIHTNVYTVVGKTGIVTLPIDNDGNTGQIRIGTELWTARTPEGTTRGAVIPVESRVRVVAVEGVTARVELLAAEVETSPSAGPASGTSAPTSPPTEGA